MQDEFPELYDRPGFLLRRAHQVAVGVFENECADVGLTAAQHSMLLAISHFPGLNQAELGRAIGFDRATVGQILNGLEARGLIRRAPGPALKRSFVIELTAEGRKLMARAAVCSQRTSEQILAPLSEAERRTLLNLLRRVTSDLNAQSRTPVQIPQIERQADAKQTANVRAKKSQANAKSARPAGRRK